MEHPRPSRDTDIREPLLRYLDFFRDEAQRCLLSLSPQQQTRSVVPSEWTPRSIVWHLVCMERRWVVWGLQGEALADPFPDDATTGDETRGSTWSEPPCSTDELIERLHAGGRHTRELVSRLAPTGLAPQGPRFPDGESTPNVQGVLLHVMHEYAQHLGHLEVAVEILGGSSGEEPPPARMARSTAAEDV